ncbi:MAG: class II aldolase/adducin family protein [Sphingomonadaceae bacterium]
MATAPKAHTMSDAEWAARQQLAACYRIFAHMKWDELIFNHITVKVPGEDGAFLINPYGLHFSEITASSLVKIDIDGNVLSETEWHVNRAGFVQHALFHRHVPDAHAIAHTHTTAGMAVASLDGGLQAINFYACNFIGQLGYHDFEGVTVRDEEGPRFLESLGGKSMMLLRNHGILVMGKTLPEVFLKHWALQRACEIQLATLSMGKPITIPADVVAVHQRDIGKTALPGGPGKAEFDAMVRLVDRNDTSWRD